MNDSNSSLNSIRDYFGSHSHWQEWVIPASLFVLIFCAISSLVFLVYWRVFSLLSRRPRLNVIYTLLQKIRSPLHFLTLVGSLAIASQWLPKAIRLSPFMRHGLRILFVLAGFWLLERCAVALIRSPAFPQKFSNSTKALFVTIVRVFIFTFAILISLDSVGISITPILASLGVGSVAVALALQDTLSNFFSGIYLLADKPFRIGDFVRIEGGPEGYVANIGWRSTVLRLLNNSVVVVPNSKLASASLTNFDFPASESEVSLAFGVGYDSDLENVERVLLDLVPEVLKKIPESYVNFPPIIRFTAFGASSIDGQIIFRVRHQTLYSPARHALIKAIHQKFRELKIEIPFPQQVVHVNSKVL